MKRLLLILILTLSFQTLAKADDIRDFEIEGMSIGDSLLNFYNENDISKAFDESYEDKVYLSKTFRKNNLKIYEAIQIAYKKNDIKKMIVSIVGVISYPNDIDNCKKQMYKIASELTDMFPSAIKKDWGKYDNNNNTGHYFPITFEFEDGSNAMVSCHDWNKKTEIDDNLKVSLFESKYTKYIKQKN